jgi:hypothetical protein
MKLAEEPWFKPKAFGYGNVPVNWKGWAVTLAFAFFVVAMVMAVETGALPAGWCVIIVLLVMTVFLLFTKAKTSGAWRWRWGHEQD